MRRGRVFIYIALILILGVVLIFVVGRPFLFPPEDTGVLEVIPTVTPTQVAVNVVVIEQPISRGNTIEEDALTLVPYPEEMVLPGMITNTGDVIGKLARFDLDVGVVLNTNLVADSIVELKRQGSDAALLIDPGMVAVSIPISRLSSVSYAPKRGDHVNVIVSLIFIDVDTSFQSRLPNNTASVIAPGTTEEDITTLTAELVPSGVSFGRSELDPLLEETFYLIPSEPQRPRLVSQTLIQNVIVLQMGEFPIEDEEKEQVLPTPTPEPGQPPAPTPVVEEEPEPKPPDVITLIVTPQDAVALNYLIFSGAELTLALRSPNDDQVILTEAVTLQFLLDQYNIPIPVKLPYAMEPRLDDLVQPTLINDATPTPEG
jgi:Flp pilus assembly protein CpaB